MFTYRTEIKGFEEISYENFPVWKRYEQLFDFLSNKLGSETASVFSMPYVSEDSINWTSELLPSDAQRLTSLKAEEQEKYLEIVSKELRKINNFYTQLKNGNTEDRKWAELIEKMLLMSAKENIFVGNNKFTLVAWGFKKTNQIEYNILSVLEGDFFPQKKKTSEKEKINDDKKKEPEILNNDEANKNVNKEDKEETETDKDEDKKIPEPEKEKELESSENNNTPNDNKKNNNWLRRNWWKILLVLFLLFLIICFVFCRSEKTILPEKPKFIPPIDTTKLISDPDSIRIIVADRLNIALQGKNKDINQFAKRFKEEYPDKNYKIIYYDTLTYRVQIEIPENLLAQIKKELPTKLSDFKMLIWHESLFKRNYQPSDPGFKNYKQNWYHKKIKALEAWDISQGDTGIVIAIIDNGFDLRHPEFKGKIYKPWNVPAHSIHVNIGKNSTHGTHVAGIALALANNGQGVSGIAPNCKFMPIQIGDYDGIMSTTSVIDGVLYAINNGADVVNMSLGMVIDPRIAALPYNQQQTYIDKYFKDEEEFWNQLFQTAYEKNIIFVLAAGNQNIMIGLDPMQRYEKTIKVSAIDPNEKKASFSNFGSLSTISAPGVQIYSSLPGNRFGFEQGTSMASPVVAGGVALLKSINPALSYDEMVDLIQSTGIPIRSPGQYMGNLIQLSAAADSTNKKRKEMPIVECPDMQKKIDSLLQEIEKIRQQCPDSVTSTDTLKIPPEADNYDFAVGRWKSTTDLHNDRNNEAIVIYFDFYADGTGRITLLEPDNTECTANLKLDLSAGKFIIDQLLPAACSPTTRTYREYYFECEPDNTGCAECWAQSKTDKSNKFNFSLIKIK